MQAGKKNRSIGETLMNKASSRSHSIFTIVVEAADTSGEHIRVGKLNLVDLAGSERQSKVRLRRQTGGALCREGGGVTELVLCVDGCDCRRVRRATV